MNLKKVIVMFLSNNSLRDGSSRRLWTSKYNEEKDGVEFKLLNNSEAFKDVSVSSVNKLSISEIPSASVPVEFSDSPASNSERMPAIIGDSVMIDIFESNSSSDA
jgi:hypothetical protein